MEKYGVESTFQADSVKEKIKETILERYGVEFISQNTIIKEKGTKTYLEHYGPDHLDERKELVERRKQTMFQRYGVHHPLQSIEINNKMQQTAFSFINYTTPLGLIRRVQGYEPFALYILFKTEHQDESNVLTNRLDVPRILYRHKDESEHYYFPDIFLKSENKLIEVKSMWTYNKDININILKWKAAQSAGYTMEFWVFTPKGERTVITVPSMVSPFLTMEEPEDV
jgi:hypothetical protein